MVAKNKLPRSYSLKGRSEIEQLFATGRRLSGAGHACIWSEAGRFGYAVFISRNHGNAVRRNRIKRLYREAIRLARPVLKKRVKIGIQPGKTAGKTDFNKVYADIRRTFERINESDQ